MTSKQRVYAMLDKVSPEWRERRASKPRKPSYIQPRVYGVLVMSSGFTNDELAKLPF